MEGDDPDDKTNGCREKDGVYLGCAGFNFGIPLLAHSLHSVLESRVPVLSF